MATIRTRTFSFSKNSDVYQLRGLTSSEETKLANALTEHQDISGKVDKVTGKGLSTNDYTTAEKNKLAGIAEGATANVGTITGITMNGASKGTSGVVNLGTVITDISGKVDKVTGKGLSTNDYTTAEKNKLAGIEAGATANAGTITGITMNGTSKGTSGVVDLGTVITDISGKVDKVDGKGLSSNDYTTIEKTKLAGIAEGATANAGTITGITMNGVSKGTSGVVNLGTVITDISGKLDTSLKGAASGLAELDANGKVPSSQLPSYVDDVLEYNGQANFPATGESGKIYVDTSTNMTYRWSGSTYVNIASNLALGETSSTAYRGDRGKEAYDHASAKGSAFASGLYKITTNAQGHVTAAAAVQKSDITGLGIPGSDTTYESKPASAGGTDLSLVTTGEKARWNAAAESASFTYTAELSRLVVAF